MCPLPTGSLQARSPPCPRQAPGVFTPQCCTFLGAAIATWGQRDGVPMGRTPRGPLQPVPRLHLKGTEQGWEELPWL